jgi:hypothetical protein
MLNAECRLVEAGRAPGGVRGGIGVLLGGVAPYSTIVLEAVIEVREE